MIVKVNRRFAEASSQKFFMKLSFRKVQISISQSSSTDFHFTKYRFPFHKVQISISQSTDFISFRFVSQSTISQSRGSPIPLSKTVSRISIWPFHASRKNQKTASRSQKKASNHVSRKNAYSIHVSQNIQIQSLQEFYETFN